MSCSKTVHIYTFSGHSASDSKKPNTSVAGKVCFSTLAFHRGLVPFSPYCFCYFVWELHGFLWLLWHICFHWQITLIVNRGCNSRESAAPGDVYWALAGDTVVISFAKTNSVLIETSEVDDYHLFYTWGHCILQSYVICPELCTWLDPESKQGLSDFSQNIQIPDFFFTSRVCWNYSKFYGSHAFI